jgi:hypothetical protein
MRESRDQIEIPLHNLLHAKSYMSSAELTPRDISGCTALAYSWV